MKFKTTVEEFVPHGEVLLLQEIEEVNETDSGLILGDEVKKQKQIANYEVLAAGNACTTAVKGMVAVLPVYATQILKIDGKEYRTVTEKNVVGFYKQK